MSAVCGGVPAAAAAAGHGWRGGEDPEHDARQRDERIDDDDGEGCVNGDKPEIIRRLLSTAFDDDDADATTTELDDVDAAQFAHIRRQEVTRLQVLPRIVQLCQQQQQHHQQQQSAAIEAECGGRHFVLDRGQIQKGQQLGTQVQLCQAEGSLLKVSLQWTVGGRK